MTLRPCEASEFGLRTACGRCGLIWDTAATDRPHCKPKADPPIGLVEMILAAQRQAADTLASQRALIGAGLRVDPYMDELRKAVVMTAIATVLERVRGDKRMIDMLREAG